MSAATTIKNMRQRLGWTLEEFAEKLNLTRTAIYNYERGERQPKPAIIMKIKQLADKNGLKIKLEDLFN